MFCRVERLEARRKRYAPVSKAPPRALDLALLADGAAFERAWAKEVSALIALKRQDTPEARLVARRARAATARLAARIEATRAATLAGLNVKARALLWERNGEPPEKIDPDGRGVQTEH